MGTEGLERLLEGGSSVGLEVLLDLVLSYSVTSLILDRVVRFLNY